MNEKVILSLITAALSGILAVLVLARDSRSFVSRVFAAGMATLAFEGLLAAICFDEEIAADIVQWQRLRIMATSLLPGIWFIFSFSFGNVHYQDFIKKYRWVILLSGGIPLILSTGFSKAFLRENTLIENHSGWSIQLGLPGYLFYLFYLIVAVLILMNLERTFRASVGSMRWQIKFVILGIGCLFAFRIYSGSQTLLFNSINSDLEMANVITSLIAGGMISIAFTRLFLLNLDICVSPNLLYNSLIVLFIGLYLVVVGILAKAIPYLRGSHNLPIEALFIFLMLVGLALLIVSGKVQQRLKEFISRHLNRPHYDYRREWREFARRTTSLMDIHTFCLAAAKILSETFGVSSTSMWLYEDAKNCFSLNGSTAYSIGLIKDLELPARNKSEILSALCRENVPIDCDHAEEAWIKAIKNSNPNHFNGNRIRYLAPLVANDRLLGMVTLNDRITGRPFSIEDFDLLKTIADQTAGSLLNLKLSAELRQAKEMEAFQSMSAFVVHDLKNLASNLSLTMQNLPVHFDNPDFRRDALRTISESLTKINGMCGHLSSLSQKLELQRARIDLNELVKNTLISLNGCPKASIVQDLQPIPMVLVDPKEIQKVLVNLLLNANEAIREGGEIRVTTMQQDGSVVFSVADTGCGMSQEFIEKSLFRPFQTTKKKGMGIGLYHSKTIVEAHGGRIDVESEEGKGTIFRVLLPIHAPAEE